MQRTVALAQMDGIAFAVAEHLKFDVARIAEIFFDIDSRIAECGLGLAAGLLHLRFQLFLAVDRLSCRDRRRPMPP